MSLPGLSPALAAFASGAGGGGGGIVISMSPGDQYATGLTSSYTFTAETATPSSGTPTSYTWSVSGYPGTWAVIAGAGTATATIRVTSAPSGTVSSAVVSCAVLIGATTYYGAANLDFERS